MPKQDTTPQNIILISSLLVLFGSFSLLYSPIENILNKLFTPCENSFSYNVNLKRCDCIDPFFGDRCENSKCVNGVPVRGQYGWSCECDNFWFGTFCDICGTYDAVNGTCFGAPPYPNSNLCRTDTYDFGEIEFLGARCDLGCFKVENTRIISGNALEVYSMLSEKAVDNILACPEASCYGCSADTREALCVSGFLKSLNSKICNLQCGPCTSQYCKPCSRRGECVLRGSSPICVCDPRSRGTGCEDLCPGVTEVFNGIASTLSGTECFGNGVCNDFAGCECYEDVEGTPRFIDNCKYECPVTNGLVCNGHGTCDLNNDGAFCACSPGWFGPSCTCSDGSVDPKTCANGDCNTEGTCTCYDDDVQGHWVGQYCNQCQNNFFTEITSCLQFCDPVTSCSNHASSCVVAETIVESNGLVKPCTITTNDDGTLAYDGTCAVCSCDANFDDMIALTPFFSEYDDGKSLAYSCMDCSSAYYPKADTQSFDAEICTTACTFETCNNRGVCMRDSGQCSCYGSCPVDATTYDGECLDVSIGMSPHISSSDNCGSCDTHWGPNLDIWQGSCIFYCNPLATAEDSLPTDCYVNSVIRDECVFCSGRASNCSSLTGKPECNCEGDYTGTYCQNACGSCNNGVCEENRLHNWFLLETPAYAKTSDASFKCTCDAVDTEDRLTFEKEMYTLVTHDLSMERVFIDLPEAKEYYGGTCQGACKVGSDGSVCNNYGNCKSTPITGLAGSATCMTDTDCNADPSNPAIEDTSYYCHLEKTPTYWQAIEEKQVFELCSADEVDFVKGYIQQTDWHDYCFEHVRVAMPKELLNVECSTCSQIVNDRSLWTNVEASCSAYLTHANQETLQENVKGDCSYVVANFDWESWCEFPSSDFASTCPAECVSNFRSVDWVGDTGFCATLDTFTSNTFLSTHACDTYKDNSIDYCRFVPEHENSYDSNTACFVDRESILDPISNRRLSNPYSGSTNQVNCKSILQNQPEVCGSITKDINPIKASCDSSVLNVLGTGLNECELRDQEHDYCSILNNRLDWTNCSLARPKCFYCGDAAHNIYSSHILFDTVNVDAATYNPNPESCCRPGDIVIKSGNTYKCHAADSYEDTCRYDACTSSVQDIDWTNKLSTLDELKRLDSIDIPALQSDSIRRSMNLSSYCSTRRTLDESVITEFSLESFDSYCNFVNSVTVTSAYTFTGNHALTEEQQLELNIIKNNWWLLNNGNIIIDSYDMEYYYVSGTNRLVTTNDILSVTDSLTYKIFNAWLYLEEANNDYVFSISISDSTAAFLQLDLRNKVLYVNNVATTLYGSTTGWHRLEVNILSNTTDIVWQHELNAEKILLNQALACFGCNTIIKEVVLESPGANNVIYHDIRLVQENEDISLTYLEQSLTKDGVSNILGKTDCTAFKATPDLKALLCPNDDCLPELAKVNFGSICTNYFSVVELTEEEKVAICASDSVCFTRLSTWDYAAYYDSYTYNDRPSQTRVEACSASECNNLLESFDYVEICSSHLREVFETCTDYSTELEEWRSSFDKVGYCTAVEDAKQDVKTLFTNELHNCSSSCLSRLDTINYYEFCNERAVYHGPFAPYGMTFNVSDNCRTELFGLDVTHDLNQDCTSIGKTGSVTGTGQCHKVSCDCTDPTIGGERCNIQCTAGSDGSSCNSESNLGTCCLSTGSEVTLANCQKDVFQSDVTIHTGQCLCYSDDIGGSNCDTFCDKCSVSNGNCINSGYCMCSAAPYEETVKSNYYETEVQQVSELQLPFNWANKQSVGYPNGLSNEQEPLYLLYTNEESCSITDVDKCCTWDDFVTNTGNPLHENYDRNQIVISTSSGDDYVCTSDIVTCAKTAISLGKTHIDMQGDIYEIQNPYSLWPLPHEIRLSESALAQEPTNLYNPSTVSQSTFLNSKCPSYMLVDGYYRVEVQKEKWVSLNNSCYDANISIGSDKGKDVWQVHELCQEDDSCTGYYKDADGDFVRYTSTPNTTCSTMAFQRPAFTPVPVATSLDVFFRNQWCKVKEVDGTGVGQSIEQASGFISSIDCTRVKDEIVSSDFNTCKFPFFIYDKDELDNYRISKINSCTDVDMFDPSGQKLLDFASLKSEITSATGIASPTYCVSESYFQNTTRFVQNSNQGYCRLNNVSYGKCTSSFVDAANCECGPTTCSVEEYCHVKDYGTTVLHECHACTDSLSPTPEKCCQKDEYYVNGVCKASCVEHWACKYNQMAQLGSTDHYMMNGIQFLKGTGPKPELFCTDSCWNPFTSTCESCDTCIANAPHQNPIDILRESKIGGYHYIKDDGTFSFDDSDNEITFVRLCQDTSNTIDNSEYALSVASKVVHEKVDFIRTDKSAQANPSSACGESCGLTCPATVDGVPCSGNGVCNKDCSCSCFTLDSNEKYILTNVEGVGFTEIPDFTVGSAMVFKSPYRGNDCSKTCPGWEDGMVPVDVELSAADKQFIMGELICSGHGTCLVNNEGEPQCQCETGYINGVNSNCEFKCPGDGCSGHGECAVSLQGTSEIFIENLFLENEFNGEVTNTIMQKAYELYPSKSTYDNLKSTYYALPEAVEDTTETEFASVKYLSKCPSSHPFPYHNGKFCCVFQTVANGTSINKRSAISECSVNNRIACPMNANFVNKDSTIEDTLKARLGLDYVGTQFIDPTKPMTTSSVCSSSIRTVEEDALCAEEARVIALNTFSDNPAHYTCDPKIALVSMRRNQRPYYDPLSVLQLGAGQTENVMYSYNDVFCSNIVASATNLNGLTLDEQPQPITLLECATCTCQQGAKSGFWDNVICDECKFGFFGESCSGMCPAVCGSVSVGSTELFYEAYQRRIGSTLPCDEPVNDNSAFYYSCPSIDNLRDILNTQAVTWDNSYQRSVYCNDGRNSPGSCLSCNSPLIGSLDIRLDEPRESCYRLTCPTNMDFFQRVNRLEDTFSINLNLAIYYSNIEFQLYGKDFGQAYDTTENTGLTQHKPIDPYEPCPTGSFVSEYHYCCTDSTKVTNYEALNLRGYFVEKHDAEAVSIQECAEKALSSATYTIGGASVQLGPYRETSKGLFAYDTQCHIFRGFESFNLLYVYDLTVAQRSLFIKRVGAGFTADPAYTIYRAYETCPSATSRVFQVWDGTLVSSATTNTISTSYELGCEFNNIYPTYFSEASDDIIDGALVGSSKDPYTTGGEAILDVINVIERDQCLTLFYEKCAHGHSSNIQNPFLTYYALMKVHEYLELQFPDGADQSGKCNIDMFKGKLWCPQCPRCDYKGSIPGVDFELVEGTKCLTGAFPYCKSSTSCTSDHWKQDDTCEYAVPNRTYYLYDATRQTVAFSDYTSTLIGLNTVDECAELAYNANTYQGVFVVDNCGELSCNCYKINTVNDNTVRGKPSQYMYQLNYSTNNGINVFEEYISTFTNGSSYDGSTLMGWYVERMRQAVPDKYRYFKIPAVSNLVEHYEQWLECTCIEDPNDVDHCETFDVRNCVKFNPLQFEWELVWYTRGSTAIPYTAPKKEVSASDIHDEDGQGAVLRTSAKLRSNVEIMENTIPDSCTEPRLDSYQVIPSLKIYNAPDVECGKETVCSCDDQPASEDGTIDYEPELIYDSTGNQLHHTECMELIGVANTYSLNMCYLEALERFNFYNGAYFGSKGLFAVERPQITNPQLYSSDEYLEYNFTTSNVLTCYVYKNVDSNVLNSDTFNVLDPGQSVCQSIENTKKGCARSKDQYRELNSNATVVGATDLYDNKCENPIFIQSYRSPHVSQTGNVFSKVSPQHSGKLACYDYGPCYSVNASGITNTKFCSCRPSIFTEQFPGLYYPNFQDTPLHNLDASQWGVVGQDFIASFGFWTSARDKVAGEGSGGFTKTVFDTYEKDILNMCYDDMAVQGNELFKLSNRELKQDQYTGYHLLFAGVQCPAFANLHQPFNTRTRGRFAADVWTEDDPLNFYGQTLKGSGHTLLQKIHVTTQGNQYYQQVSGSPDGSMSASECETYAGVSWGGSLSISGEIKGCYIITGTGATAGNVYFNTDTTSTALCSLATRACIQRRYHGGDLNYIFGKALFMLDYRQVDMSSLYFGDPNYGTPVFGTEIHPIPYESVIKSYCDAGEQPYKRFGPCVNLKGSRVNGKIYMKHFHDSDHYKVKELKTWDSKNSDEYYEVESGAPDMSVSPTECQAFNDAQGYTYNSNLNNTANPKGCFSYPTQSEVYYNSAATGTDCSSTKPCIQKLEISVEGDVLLEHDTVILIIKDGKYFAVNNFIPVTTATIEKDRFKMYTHTYNARAAIREPMFTKHSFYDSHTCAPHGATVNPRINAPVQEVTDAFLFMRPQNEAIVKQGTCQPQQSADSTDSWGNMAVCEDLAAAQINGVSYAPSCSCPIGFANMRYIDYNQPWSLHGGCSSIEGDYKGGFIDYKPCNGIGTCSVYLDTPQCCGYDTVTCDAQYKGRCVDATGKPKLDTLDHQFCNRPFAGCSKKQRNGLAIDEDNIECGGPTAVEDTFNGMTEEWVKIADYVEESRTTNDATDEMQGVVYVDGKPRDAMRSNYAILTSGCYACTDGRYNAEEGKVECRGCFEGKYSVNTKNPWTIPPTQNNGYLKSDRGEKVYEYEWWKVNGYPTEGATWHEVNEWLVKKPLEPYQLNSDGVWEYNPTIPMNPVIAHNWVTNEYATSCANCPDNYASIPLAAENNNTGDAALGYPGFPDDSTRVRTNNRNCLVCPPGYDTGVADHLQVGISRSVQEECPYDYPFAFSTKDHAPYYGSYCCKNEAKRINPYMFHTTASDGCDDYVRCTSEFDYATNGFYCVDAVRDIPTHQIEVHMWNNRENVCTQYITSNALEYENICEFVEVSSGNPVRHVSESECQLLHSTEIGSGAGNYDWHGTLSQTVNPAGCFYQLSGNTYKLYYNTDMTSTEPCGNEHGSICIQKRSYQLSASHEHFFISVDAYMTIELKYRNVEGAVKLVINIDPNHPYTKEDTFQDIQLRRIVPNYNILLDKDISCNGIFLEKTFTTIFFDRTLNHGSYEKIQLGSNVDEGACAILVIDYHKRQLEKSTIQAYFTLEAGTCYTYADEVCADGCIESNLPGKTMRIAPYGTDITGSSCFLQSVLDIKEGSAFCRKCPRGKFNSRAGANCLPCSIGKYQDEEGKVSCKICENNKYEFTTGSATCITCPAGSENKVNDPVHCNLCEAGTYSDDSSDCKECPAGKTIAFNFASFAGKELQITNLDTTVVTGPMINYDPRYDYTAITGYAELDVYGNYITGFSPFFEGMQHMQLTSHDSINDCIDCKHGFVSSPGDHECLACAVGKYAITDSAGQTTCQFCRNGVVKYRQNTFVSVGNFICNPLERLGEVIDDIGIVTENDFTYAETTNAAFLDYVTVTSEQDAKIFCMKHSTCQGYVQKVMRDGSIEWQVPKSDESGIAISKTYTQYEDSVPDYYAYEKVAADNLCGNDDTCVGYYEDTALSKTYKILPFTVEEEGIYNGQTFTVEKDAVKHCAASATCEGVSKVETYDPFVAAEEVLTIGYQQVTTGNPAQKEDATYVTESECTAYAQRANLATIIPHSHNNEPQGCWKFSGDNKVYFNTDGTSSGCSSTFKCIQKKPATVHPDEILLTIPDQAENNAQQCKSDADAEGAPFVELPYNVLSTYTTCEEEHTDFGFRKPTLDECSEIVSFMWAQDLITPDGTSDVTLPAMGGTTSNVARPDACYLWIGAGVHVGRREVWYPTASNTNSCNRNDGGSERYCVCKSEYNAPYGCSKVGDTYVYNHGNFKTSRLSCRAYSLQHNYLFWDLVINYIEVDSGSPAVEADATYVTESECAAYAHQYNLATIIPHSHNNEPHGCWKFSGDNNVYFNTDGTSSGCSSTFQCIQKGGNNMLCQLGNTLQ